MIWQPWDMLLVGLLLSEFEEKHLLAIHTAPTWDKLLLGQGVYQMG